MTTLGWGGRPWDHETRLWKIKKKKMGVKRGEKKEESIFVLLKEQGRHTGEKWNGNREEEKGKGNKKTVNIMTYRLQGSSRVTVLSVSKAPSPSRTSMTSCWSRSQPKVGDGRLTSLRSLGVPAAATTLPNPSHFLPCWSVTPTC